MVQEEEKVYESKILRVGFPHLLLRAIVMREIDVIVYILHF